MRHYNTLLNELLTHIPRYQFEKLTKTYKTDLYVKSFTPWPQFVTLLYAKPAVKIHCQLDYGGNIPSFLVVTEGKRSDISVAWDEFSFTPDSINCFDRGYVDYALYRPIHEAKAFFVTRVKSTMAYRVVGQQ